MAFSREVLKDPDSRAWMWFRKKKGRWEGCSEGTWKARAFNLIMNDRKIKGKKNMFVSKIKVKIKISCQVNRCFN